MDDPWLDIGTTCRHCGTSLEARPRATTGRMIVIDGESPMEYRHKWDHSKLCTRVERYTVRPHSSWGDYTAWCSVQAGMGVEEDNEHDE